MTHFPFPYPFPVSSPISRFLLKAINEYIVLFDSGSTLIHSILAVSGCRVSGVGCRVSGVGCRVVGLLQSTEYRVQRIIVGNNYLYRSQYYVRLLLI